MITTAANALPAAKALRRLQPIHIPFVRLRGGAAVAG